MATFKTRNVALLTGAGFTKSFGGYLATEMWAKIFNNSHIQSNEEIRRCMLNKINFESAYAAVMDSDNYSDKEKKAFTEAIRAAFRNMHENIIERSQTAPQAIGRVFDLFIKFFCGDENERGLFFTLNQDLFMELAFGNSEDRTVDFDIFGLEKKAWFLDSVLEGIETHPILLPDEDSVEKIKANLLQDSSQPFLYLKLHGSYGWRKKDGSDAMVIGDLKTKAIAEEPLLRCYHELFQETLFKPGQKLVVIGYRFGDPHINRAIAEGIRHSGLRLYIVNPADIHSFLQNFPSPLDHEVADYVGTTIWEGLGGYHQGKVEDFYNSFLLTLTHDGETFLGNCGLI